MNKSIIIGLLIVLLAGGGITFAQYGPETILPGVRAELEADMDEMVTGFEIEDTEELPSDENGSNETDDDNGSDETGDENGSDETDENGSDETDDDTGSDDTAEEAKDNNRSEVATAVHTALSGDPDLGPGDEGFGQAVAERAREGGLGEMVSEAARQANGSINANGKGKSGDKPGKAVGNPNR